jgi:hypothetical protein
MRGALRDALGGGAVEDRPAPYSDTLEAHELGSILVSAVFEAFATIYRRKTERYFRLATQGTGVLPPGEIPHDLEGLLADVVAKLASQFLSICIRAIDYCPPVGLTFGDYLRALVTADFDLIPDDPWDYRGAIIESFRRRNIYPRHVPNLSEDALLWRGTRKELPPVEALSFANLKFRGDPACVAGDEELRRQANALGEFISRAAYLEEFGLIAWDDPRLEGDEVSRPRVESIRSARRTGPNGQVVFDLIAEVTQLRRVQARADCPAFAYHGGGTIILDPEGKVRYVVLKSVVGEGRLDRRRQFLSGALGQRYWEMKDGAYHRRKHLFRLLHAQKRGAADET